MESDWTTPDVDTSLRQGDLLIRRNPTTGSISDICIVITADCDIANSKFGRQVLCLRVVDFDHYFRTTWSERRLARVRETSIRRLQDQIKKWHGLAMGGVSGLTSERIVAWVQESEPDSICTALKVPEKERKSLVQDLVRYRAAVHGAASGLLDFFEQLVRFRSLFEGKDEAAIHLDVVKQVRSEKLQDDVFLLPTLPEIGVGSAIAPAAVLLREVVGAPIADVCFRAVDAITAEHFLRIGRLTPSIKYAISQAFGNLYSRIGLSTEYERRCGLAMENVGRNQMETT